MSDLKYTDQHEWVKLEGDSALVGISKYATEQLGDIVYVELPEEGREAAKGDELAVVESVKAASEVYSPISGAVTEINGALEENPGLVNEDPEGAGWFAKLNATDAGELDALMDAEAYAKFVEGLG